jgi:hypothetical protein
LRLLLDTHTLFWSVDDPARVSTAAMTAMQNPANDRLLSAATIWDMIAQALVEGIPIVSVDVVLDLKGGKRRGPLLLLAGAQVRLEVFGHGQLPVVLLQGRRRGIVVFLLGRAIQAGFTKAVGQGGPIRGLLT